MALIPNQTSHQVFDIPIETDDFTETMGSMSVYTGYYQAKGDTTGGSGGNAKDGTVLIESDKMVLNQLGLPIRQDVEEYDIEVFKAPPTEYRRVTKSSCYLPGYGRAWKTVEEETIVYWCFTPLSAGDNLGRTRFVDAFAVYDMPVVEKPMDPKTKATLTAAGWNVENATVLERVIQSGEKWDEATTKARVIEGEERTQVTKWVKNIITEHEIVEEEVDKWTIWNIRKNAVKPQDCKVEGPRHIKKTGFTYAFPFPLTPPKLKAQNFQNNYHKGVKLEAEGGGVVLENKWFKNKIKIVPEKYNFYRATISEPDREASGDPYGSYISPPAAVPKPTIIGTSGTTDPDGNPDDPKPPSSGHPEPDDPSPPEPPKEVSFTMIGTVNSDNQIRWKDKGHAVFYDEDVEQGAIYEYYCEAVIRESVSPESNHESIEYTLESNRNRRSGIRRADNGDIEADADAPDDPGLPPTDYGEVVELDVPAVVEDDEDVIDLMDEIAPRQFASSEPDFNLSVNVLTPILGLEYGQGVQMPQILWETYGNQLIMSQETLMERWHLVGFSFDFKRDEISGAWSSQQTKLNLRRRSKRSA